MRRIFAAVSALVMILMLSCVPAYADGGRLYAVYVPRTDRGTLFYLDIYCDDVIGAVKLELDYNADRVEYRDVSAASTTSTVGARAENGTVTVVLGDSGCISGCLCRLTFKMLSSGEATFAVRMLEGVDGDLRPLNLPEEEYLTVTLGSNVQSGSSGKAHSGSVSRKEKQSPSETSTDDEAIPAVRDLSGHNTGQGVLICICAVIAAALLVNLGFILGERYRKKHPAAKESGKKDESDDS